MSKITEFEIHRDCYGDIFACSFNEEMPYEQAKREFPEMFPNTPDEAAL